MVPTLPHFINIFHEQRTIQKSQRLVTNRHNILQVWLFSNRKMSFSTLQYLFLYLNSQMSHYSSIWRNNFFGGWAENMVTDNSIKFPVFSLALAIIPLCPDHEWILPLFPDLRTPKWNNQVYIFYLFLYSNFIDWIYCNCCYISLKFAGYKDMRCRGRRYVDGILGYYAVGLLTSSVSNANPKCISACA